MFLGGRLGHLAYSTLVHPGDTWEEMRESLETYAPAVKARVSPDAPYGVSLRISAASAETLTARRRRAGPFPSLARRTRHVRLHGQRLPVRTVQGPRRDGAGLRARLVDRRPRPLHHARSPTSSPRSRPSRSHPRSRPRRSRSGPRCPATRTSTCSPRTCSASWRTSSNSNEGPAGGSSWRWSPSRSASSRPPTRRCATSRSTSGRRTGLRRLVRLTGLPASEVAGLVRRHLGVVFDICHQSVQFEDIAASLRLLRDCRRADLQVPGGSGALGAGGHGASRGGAGHRSRTRST